VTHPLQNAFQGVFGYAAPVAKRNYLVEGGSGTGKSSVCRELRKRGYTAVDGDNELAYQGDPETGRRTEGPGGHEQHIWDVDKVREIAADTEDDVAFFCGGSRNFHKFLDIFDKVIVLDVDTETLKQRLAGRAADDWGGNDEEKEMILRLHATKEDIPKGMIIDTARPLDDVVDAIVKCLEA
jgi:broad-specificity NMP kinase